MHILKPICISWMQKEITNIILVRPMLGAAKWLSSICHEIVVSNTFTQLWEMQPYFDLAKNLTIVVRCLALLVIMEISTAFQKK